MKQTMVILDVTLLFLVVLFAVQTVLAGVDGYDLSWKALFPGGAASGGLYSMDSAVGQPFAGKLTGSSYELCAGYLCGVKAETKLYLPAVSKQ